jgi:hypothetical protein
MSRGSPGKYCGLFASQHARITSQIYNICNKPILSNFWLCLAICMLPALEMSMLGLSFHPIVAVPIFETSLMGSLFPRRKPAFVQSNHTTSLRVEEIN